MNNFKFRAWDDVAKRMSHGKKEQFDDMLAFRFDHFDDEKPIFMLWTGLYDKTKWEDLTESERENWTQRGNFPSEWKGKEGYHKDIVRMAVFLYTIEWCDKSAKFYLKSINGIDTMKYTMTHFTKNGYIEGNVFQNPELLEKK